VVEVAKDLKTFQIIPKILLLTTVIFLCLFQSNVNCKERERRKLKNVQANVRTKSWKVLLLTK